jgi:hypothetical protein
VQCGPGIREKEQMVIQNGKNGGEPCLSQSERTVPVACDGTNCDTPTQAPDAPTTTTRTTTRTTTVMSAAPSPPPAGEVEKDIRFTMNLYGKENLLTATEQQKLVDQIAAYLQVPASQVKLISGASGARRLVEGRRLMLTVAIELPKESQANFPQLEQAVSSGELMTQIQSGDDFPATTHIGYARDTISIIQQGNREPDTFTQAPDTTVRKGNSQLPDGDVAIVYIVMGVKEEAPERGSDLGDPTWETSFDFSRASAQTALEELCREAVIRRPQLATRKNSCFVNDFKVFLKSKGVPEYPVSPGSDVHRYLREFVNSVYGKEYKDHVGFTQGGLKVSFIAAKFYTELSRELAADDAWHWVENWDDWMEDMNNKYSGSGTGQMFHTSELWVRAETEKRLIVSTLICAAVSVVFALVMTSIFLWNVILSVYLIFGIVSVIICLAATMFGVIGWKFGAVEAIGLIVFVGFSVDYSLHMAESYHQSTAHKSVDKVKEGIRRTGGAVFASAVTSALSGFPILFCQIQVFLKFGVVIVLNTALSLFFSLCFLCSLLIMIGPQGRTGSLDLLTGRHAPLPPQDVNADVVPGTIIAVDAGGPTNDGYRWTTGDEEADAKNDPKKPQKGAPPQKGAATETEDNGNFNPVVEEPTVVTAPAGAGPTTLGAPVEEAEIGEAEL